MGHELVVRRALSGQSSNDSVIRSLRGIMQSATAINHSKAGWRRGMPRLGTLLATGSYHLEQNSGELSRMDRRSGHHLPSGRTIAASAIILLAAASVTPPSQAATSFDGLYRGTSQLVADKAPSCRQSEPVTLDIHDGHFRLVWHQPQVFDAKVSPDGTFYSTAGSPLAMSDKHMMDFPVLRGRLTSGMLSAEYGTRWCQYQLDLQRS
jgi:hypothetical protein